MPSKIVHLFRHAEASHNLDRDVSIPDPLLTPTGFVEAETILDRYPFLNRPTLILVSPLRRCITTALAAFHPTTNLRATSFFADVPRIVAIPHLQEITENPCDTGSSLATLKAEYDGRVEFPQELFDCEEWYKKRGTPFANDNQLLNNRAEFVRRFIQRCPDVEIILVTHGDFCHFLVNRWLYGPGCGTLFNGLQRAQGVPMQLVTKNGTSEMQVEIPSWHH